MALHLKSVVFKTDDLKKTMAFFIQQMRIRVYESSIDHFVIHCNNVRILFIHHQHDSSPELYYSFTNDSSATSNPTTSEPGFTLLTDPNGIKIIITHEPKSNH